MTEKVFKTDFISFTDRIKSDVFFNVLIIFGITIYWIFSNEVNYVKSIFLIFFIIVALLHIIENYINSIIFISEIRIDKEKITLIGYEFNNKWKEEIDIKKLKSKLNQKLVVDLTLSTY